jgi:hypothetical protein
MIAFAKSLIALLIRVAGFGPSQQARQDNILFPAAFRGYLIRNAAQCFVEKLIDVILSAAEFIPQGEYQSLMRHRFFTPLRSVQNDNFHTFLTKHRTIVFRSMATAITSKISIEISIRTPVFGFGRRPG